MKSVSLTFLGLCTIACYTSLLAKNTPKAASDARLFSADNAHFDLFFDRRNIFSLDARLGFLSSSLRDREDELIRESNLTLDFGDGRVEQFQGVRLDQAFAFNYERAVSRFFGFRATYQYGVLRHGMSIGGYGDSYARESALKTMMETHTVLIGTNFRFPIERIHGFYLEFPLQIGPTSGRYRPLVSYTNARDEYSFNLANRENENTLRTFLGFQMRMGVQFAWYSAFASVFAVTGLHYSYAYNQVEAGYKGSASDRIFKRFEMSIGAGVFL
ncbi:hypothetical protein [Turneriella parva]|uniref:Outer membrane protein beta-barrel domain-containing protein n=1 Tax=Turneriella parva (strain ATCC BAA-1111 / DSM 21527 / NCTC 11395 / H) TaxID=869212 RepID=I4B278_TURPD|nr:hypothetical protein [Turneriella parva]AFM11385.1 hypothetical protein Turpa_0734 [Turneriella parva DSM 21527]